MKWVRAVHIPVLLPALIMLASCSGVLPASNSTSQSASTSVAPPLIELFSYQDYAAVLTRYVNENGDVDYRGLQANSERLRAFNESLGNVTPETFQAWNEAEQMAFLINAYNSFTLQSIIDQNPIKASIRDIPGVWRVRRFAIAGQSKTLDDIEHGTLRKNYSDPRIHAALNCTARSCPVLRHEPYTGDALNVQLEEQVQQWLSSPVGLQIDRTQNRVGISMIFDWFGEDWIPTYGNGEGFTGNDKQRAALNFISRYVSPEDRDYLKQGDYQVYYLEYDWALNSQ